MPKPLAEILAHKNRNITHRFQMLHPDIPQEEIELIYQDMLRYLWLAADMAEKRTSDSTIPDTYIAMGMSIIDEMWHCFILYTQFYEKFCTEYLGQFIHHPPIWYKWYDNKKELGEEKANEIILTEMVEYVMEAFGEDVAIRWFDTYNRYLELGVVH